MYHSFDERIYSTIIFSLSKRVALCSKFDIFHQCPMKGPIKKRFPVCLSVCLSISSSAFLSGMGGCYFFQIFCTMVDYWNISKLSEPFFPGKFISPKIWGKIAQNDPKIGFFEFFEKF